MKDISHFKKGEFIKSLFGSIYEVMDYKIEAGRRRMETTGSICRDVDTNKECIVTWNKKCNFELYEPPQ